MRRLCPTVVKWETLLFSHPFFLLSQANAHWLHSRIRYIRVQGKRWIDPLRLQIHLDEGSGWGRG